MPTPAIYSSISQALASWPRKSPVLFWSGVLLIAGIPPLLERFVPAVGTTPGRALFVVLFGWVALLAPYFAFRNPSAFSNNAAWVRACLCSLWVVLCLWAIYVGLFSNET